MAARERERERERERRRTNSDLLAMEGSSSQFELDLQRREIEIQALAEAEADAAAEAEAEAAGEEERDALREEMVRFIEDSRRDGTRRARETSGRLENGLGRRSTLLVVSLASFLLLFRSDGEKREQRRD